MFVQKDLNIIPTQHERVFCFGFILGAMLGLVLFVLSWGGLFYSFFVNSVLTQINGVDISTRLFFVVILFTSPLLVLNNFYLSFHIIRRYIYNSDRESYFRIARKFQARDFSSDEFSLLRSFLLVILYSSSLFAALGLGLGLMSIQLF